MRSVVLITFLLYYTKVNALKCYICDSTLHGPSCYDPMDESNIKAMDCKDVYRYQRIEYNPTLETNLQSEKFDFMQPEKLQGWNPNMNPSYNPNTYSRPTDFECFQYDKMNTRDGRRIFVRGCHGKNQNPNYCAEIASFGPHQGYKLNKCDVCYDNYCNGSGSIKLSLLLNFAFFLLFYRCTDF